MEGLHGLGNAAGEGGSRERRGNSGLGFLSRAAVGDIKREFLNQ